jgi:Holliday junction resolvasome RuvABC endonuclease subunit
MLPVLGIDPSLTATGLAYWQGSKPVLLRIITNPTSPEPRAKAARVFAIVGEVLAFAPEECVTVIEAPVVATGGASGALFDRAGVYWLLVKALWERGPVVVVQPATRSIYATGKGNASKRDVLASMRSRHRDLEIADDNEADALALCAMGARWQNEPFDGQIGPEVMRAMNAVHWPRFQRPQDAD